MSTTLNIPNIEVDNSNLVITNQQVFIDSDSHGTTPLAEVPSGSSPESVIVVEGGAVRQVAVDDFLDGVQGQIDTIGVVTTASGNVSVVKDQWNDVCSITLAGGHTYIVVALLSSDTSDSSAYMALMLNGANIAPTVRTSMISGGGLCLTRVYSVVSNTTLTIKTYGYPSNAWTAYGEIQAVCVK